MGRSPAWWWIAADARRAAPPPEGRIPSPLLPFYFRVAFISHPPPPPLPSPPPPPLLFAEKPASNFPMNVGEGEQRIDDEKGKREKSNPLHRTPRFNMHCAIKQTDGEGRAAAAGRPNQQHPTNPTQPPHRPPPSPGEGSGGGWDGDAQRQRCPSRRKDCRIPSRDPSPSTPTTLPLSRTPTPGRYGCGWQIRPGGPRLPPLIYLFITDPPGRRVPPPLSPGGAPPPQQLRVPPKPQNPKCRSVVQPQRGVIRRRWRSERDGRRLRRGGEG